MTAKNKALQKKAKILVLEKELNVSRLARLIRKSRTWTSQVLYGHEKSEVTRKAIAEELGEYLWTNSHKKTK